MEWRCAPEFRDANHPEFEAVMLTYVEQPECFEVVSTAGLCRRLRASGKRVVPVAFHAWKRLGVLGYNIETIDGQPLPYIGNTGGSGGRGSGVSCPMDRLFP